LELHTYYGGIGILYLVTGLTEVSHASPDGQLHTEPK